MAGQSKTLLNYFLISSLFFPFLACNLSDNSQMQSSGLKPPLQYATVREAMVREQIAARGISDIAVLKAMQSVPRHLFLPEHLWHAAYSDRPLPIGEGQTISQPYIVAFMTQALQLNPNMKVLEIGTGSGYQAAVLAELVKEVYTIEIICSLAETAEKRLQEMDYDNIWVKCGDGYQGWPEVAPFDGIIITAAPDHIPQPLTEQLADGGRMVLPVGDFFQELVLLTKTKEGIGQKSLLPVRFVPMTGEAQETRP
jgi:protein-L-isoaspartate(D-aspartate) O-methyltransferase